LKLLS